MVNAKYYAKKYKLVGNYSKIVEIRLKFMIIQGLRLKFRS